MLSAVDSDSCRSILRDYPQLARQKFDFGHRIDGYGGSMHSQHHRRVYPILQLCYRQAPLDLIQLACIVDDSDSDNPKEEMTTATTIKSILSDADAGGYTALHWACCGTLTSLDVVQLLVQLYPTAIHQLCDGSHRTCLHLACGHGLAHDVIQFLLQQCPYHALQRDHCQNLPLHLACASGGPLSQLSVIQMLSRVEPASVEATSQIGLKNSKTGILYRSIPPYCSSTMDRGYAPLHYACAEGASLPVVRFLVRHYPGALQMRAGSMALPLHLACSKRFPSLDIVSFLVSQYPQALKLSTTDGCNEGSGGGGGTPLQLATKSRPSLQVIQFLYQQCPAAMQLGQDLNQRRPHLALQYACCNGASSQVIEFLLEKTIMDDDPSTSSCAIPKRCNGETVLHMVCRNQASHHALIPAMLIRYPDYVSVTSHTTGDLPLHVACKAGASIDTLQLLLSKNLEAIRICNKDGDLPLHLLVKAKDYNTRNGGDMNALKYIVDQFPEALTAENCNHRTPFGLAMSLPVSGEETTGCTCSPSKSAKVVDPTSFLGLLENLTPRLPPFQETATGRPLPLHFLVSQKSCTSQIDTMRLFLTQMPTACYEKSKYGELPCHVATGAPGMSLTVIELLFHQNPEALQVPNQDGLVPFQIAATTSPVSGNEAEHLSVLYFLVHQSMFAFENLSSLRERRLETPVDNHETQSTRLKMDDCQISVPSSLSRILQSILEDHRAAYEKRIGHLEQQVRELQKEDLERQAQDDSCASCCCIT